MTPVNTLSGEKSTLDASIKTRTLALTIGAPKLAEPFWYRHAHSGIWTSEKEINAAMSPEAAKVYRRKRTKAARVAARTSQMAASRQRALASLAA